ncbi:SDR family oxidoreductase [Metabacillus mangrovi]|nr:SDR family oxidoreductase [Metabacillus mangrovi]
MKLINQLAIVTGGSRGLGAAISKALGREGAFVAVNYFTNSKPAVETAEAIIRMGGQAAAIQADVTEEREARRLVKEAEEASGLKAGILVNNATGPQPELSIEEVTWEDYEDQLRFFVKAPLHMLQACLPSMKERKHGSIINIGSEVVHLGNSHFSNYTAAKSAMIGMTRSWASELGPTGIRVNLVHPGFIPVERHQEVPEEAIRQYRSGVPLGRMGVPEDAAKTVVYLASEDASFITGQSLSVNGGNTYGM